MSRRRSADRLSPLDQQFAERGLLRPGEIARVLGVSVDQVMPLIKSGRIKSETFQWGDQRLRGVPIEEADRIGELLAKTR
jgi:hypothetical protein